MKGVILLCLLSVVMSLTLRNTTCNKDAARTDCDVDGQGPCEAAGCCWDPVNPNPNNLPWCFKATGPPGPPPPPPSGPCDPNNRTDCGHMGTNKQDCESAGCCWQPTGAEGVPWCFFHSVPSPSCKTSPECSGHGTCPASSPGVCQCDAGWSTCGSPSANDCSVNVTSDDKNCGHCGNVCQTGPGVVSNKCVSGSCDLHCDSTSGYIACFGSCVKATNCSTVGPFSPAEMKIMQGFFLANIDIDSKGGVVASPDKTVPGGGSYYYHWMRDGALTMRTVFLLNQTLPNADGLLKAYVAWVLNNQGEKSPHSNCDIQAEPKFNLPNGDVFTGGWCRPQNDGPGLRGGTLSMYALSLVANGESAFVDQNLWTKDGSHQGGAIKFDLDWVVDNWESNSCDLWEEIQSSDIFWNRMSHRHGLLMGAKVATAQGDTTSASKYTTTAKAIEATLPAHWTGSYVQASTTRPKDSSVVNAFNDAYMNDGLYGPTDAKVAGTVSMLVDLFNTAYTINQKDTAAGIPGMLVGRYEGDHYGGGGPWILLSASLGELYLRGATEVLKMGRLPDEEAMKSWRSVLGLSAGDKAANSHVHFARAMADKGDGVLLRIRHHVKAGGFHLSEQLDRDTGVPKSATDLTWSYSAVLKAMHRRTEYYNTAAELGLSF